jgi:hypothetical protein
MTRLDPCDHLLDRRIAAGNGDRLAPTGPAGDGRVARTAGPLPPGRAAVAETTA